MTTTNTQATTSDPYKALRNARQRLDAVRFGLDEGERASIDRTIAEIDAELSRHDCERILDAADAIPDHVREQAIDVAREEYEHPSDDDIEIADNPIVTRSADGGYWVDARVFVRLPEEDDEDDDGDEDVFDEDVFDEDESGDEDDE